MHLSPTGTYFECSPDQGDTSKEEVNGMNTFTHAAEAEVNGRNGLALDVETLEERIAPTGFLIGVGAGVGVWLGGGCGCSS